jgi:hypothetical protein
LALAVTVGSFVLSRRVRRNSSDSVSSSNISAPQRAD